jgi:uncharacterized cupredoxin-like copper-binding protein
MTRLLTSIALSLAFALTAHADDKHSGQGGHAGHSAKSAEKTYGEPGDPKKVTRTIEVGMTDAMRFTPSKIAVKRGETIRFVAKNSGKVEHEFVLGTERELKAHAEAMKKNPKMEHGPEANAVDVDPGKQGELVWRFTKAGTFSFGCLVPGHYEAGMVGTVVVR